MNSLSRLSLKLVRRFYLGLSPMRHPEEMNREKDPDKVSELISDKLTSPQPCMIARYGAFELNSVINYLGITRSNKNIFAYIKGEIPEWWWDKKLMGHMQTNAGFFPATEEMLSRFAEMMLEDSKYVDVLGSWQNNELKIKTLPNSHIKVDFEPLNPFFASVPWTKALEGKKVLVVHPFARSIQQQFARKDKIFSNNLLPDFDLEVIPAVQSIGGNVNDFQNWFEALDFMKEQIDQREYDICLLGCGAYGFPLAAHIKRQGKKSFHLGGSLQLLFGIRGSRWENPIYNPIYNYSNLMNEYWVKPQKDETPNNANNVEGACYW